MKKIIKNDYSLIVDERLNTINIDIYSFIKKNDSKQRVYYEFYSYLLSSRTDKLEKPEFLKKAVDLYGCRFDISYKSFSNYNVLIHRLKYINPKLKKEVNEKEILILFKDYMNNNIFNKEELDTLKKDYLNYVSYLNTQYDTLADVLLTKHVSCDTMLTFKDYKEIIKEITYENFIEFIKNIKIVDQYAIICANEEVENKIDLIKNEDIKVCESDLKEFKDVILNKKNDQASIKLAYLFEKTDFYKLQVYSTILGGDANSLLFTNLREKKQLAYSVYSNIINKKGLEISIQTNKKTIKKAIKCVDDQFELINNLTKDELEFGKQRVVSEIVKYSKEIAIGVKVLSDNYMFKEQYDLEKKIENINNITLEDIKTINKNIKYLGKVIVK